MNWATRAKNLAGSIGLAMIRNMRQHQLRGLAALRNERMANVQTLLKPVHHWIAISKAD